ncbi:MAG: Type II secretion system protein F [Pseudomonadales bacterium]|nr:Type II secretion system protein F [Pseudomonadales bacterium]
MAVYSYAAFDATGKRHRGSVEADSAYDARQTLRARGMLPLEVRVVEVEGQSRRLVAPAGLSVLQAAVFTRQLATLLHSSLPVADALAAIVRQTEGERAKSLIAEVRRQITEGSTLADALRRHPRVFAPVYTATVAAGEQTGRLDLVLARLAEHMEARHRARQKLVLALTYPCLLCAVAVLVVAGLLTYIVPDVVAVFAREGHPLPAPTRALLATSGFLRHWGVLVVLVVAGGAAGLRLSLRNARRRERVDRWALSLPFVGKLLRAAGSAHFAGTLGTLLHSGMPLVDALGVVTSVLGNTWLKQTLTRATAQVREGASLTVALEQHCPFSPMTLCMIGSAEQSGTLESMLERIAEREQFTFDNHIATLIGLLEPVVLLLMGVAVLGIVIAILQPIFTLSELI